MDSKKPKGFGKFDRLMRKLVKVCPDCRGKGFYMIYPRGRMFQGQKILCHCGDEKRRIAKLGKSK